jgi:poly-gamma-glutamate capsule biosynthesis protein CapA/YwtB (metallophosphatase superfamily)
MKTLRRLFVTGFVLLLIAASCSRPAELVIEAEYDDSDLTLVLNIPVDEALLAEQITLKPAVPVLIKEEGENFAVIPREAWPEDTRITLTVHPFSTAVVVLDHPFTYTFQTPPPPEFDLVAVGDVMLDYLTSEKLRRYDPGYPFAAIAPVLKQGDLVFANLECPISDRGKPVQKTYTFRAHTFAIDALTASGINLVSLANNHILDYGTGALEDTLTLLEEHDIAYAGAGRDEAQARKGAAFEINGIKTAVLAYSGVFKHVYPAWEAGPEKPGALYYREREQFIADIEKARRWADVVIVSLHFGDEYTHRVNREQQETGRLAVDSGADLVLGHHSHAPQGIEIYRGKPIVYSLGNFLFYPFAKTICNESYILRARIGRNGVESMRLLPVLLGDSQPYPATGEEAVRLHALLTGLLDELDTSWEIDGDAIAVLTDP